MDYIDPYNFPEKAVREYDVNGGSVTPDLFHGTIFRIDAEENFTMERLRHQIDGAKFFIELYNPSAAPVFVDFNSDYRATDLGVLSSGRIDPSGVIYYEGICRIGLMLLYNQTGVLVGNVLLNPKDGAVLLNPATGEPLLNPK